MRAGLSTLETLNIFHSHKACLITQWPMTLFIGDVWGEKSHPNKVGCGFLVPYVLNMLRPCVTHLGIKISFWNFILEFLEGF